MTWFNAWSRCYSSLHARSCCYLEGTWPSLISVSMHVREILVDILDRCHTNKAAVRIDLINDLFSIRACICIYDRYWSWYCTNAIHETRSKSVFRGWIRTYVIIHEPLIKANSHRTSTQSFTVLSIIIGTQLYIRNELNKDVWHIYGNEPYNYFTTFHFLKLINYSSIYIDQRQYNYLVAGHTLSLGSNFLVISRYPNNYMIPTWYILISTYFPLMIVT